MFAMVSRRIFLASAAGLLLPSLRIEAATEVEVECICLLCKTKFTAIMDASGTSWGKRLDLKPLGAIRAPWRLPVCPKCRFVEYKDKIDAEELRRVQEYVNSDEYKSIPAQESSYYLLGKIYEHLRKPPLDIAYVYLKASWQVGSDAKRHQAYLEHSLTHFTKFVSTDPPKDDVWKTARFLRGEILRQLQRFEEGQRLFQMLKTQDGFTAEPYARLIKYELELIDKSDSAPHPIPEPDK
jgi:hypothetical protein